MAPEYPKMSFIINFNLYIQNSVVKVINQVTLPFNHKQNMSLKKKRRLCQLNLSNNLVEMDVGTPYQKKQKKKQFHYGGETTLKDFTDPEKRITISCLQRNVNFLCKRLKIKKKTSKELRS